MKKATMKIKKSETKPKPDVLADFKCAHGAKPADIAVFVKDWAVALKGGKWDAVQAAKWVASVKSIAGGIEKLPDSQRRMDKDIAATATNQIYLSSTVPKGTVGIMVHDGWITLEGEVGWCYQKNYAANAVEHLAGVKGVSNQMTIKPNLASEQVETAVKSASDQIALLIASKSKMEVAGNKEFSHFASK